MQGQVIYYRTEEGVDENASVLTYAFSPQNIKNLFTHISLTPYYIEKLVAIFRRLEKGGKWWYVRTVCHAVYDDGIFDE